MDPCLPISQDAVMTNPLAWLKTWTGERALERRAVIWPLPPLTDLIGPTVAGMTVDATTATKVPAVFSCCQVLSQDLARTPIRLRQQVDDDTSVDALDHPLYEILHDLANPEMTAYQFKAAMEWNLLVYGRAYAEIVRVDGRVTQLWPLDPQQMTVDRVPGTWRKRWTYAAGAQG